MEFFQLILILHIIGGFTALFTFWIPVVTKKGGKLHSMSGWGYVGGMIVVAISAFYLGMYRLFDPGQFFRNHIIYNVFNFYRHLKFIDSVLWHSGAPV
ncbi:DUF2306 domain-containing protein [Domibacillus epiphyticus]|uniref:hypothetical protein n=1 Tax=Domibacillus epiphyticus TaxID=1714355 RepID=UPI0026B16421